MRLTSDAMPDAADTATIAPVPVFLPYETLENGITYIVSRDFLIY
jgi:hypothetical protein